MSLRERLRARQLPSEVVTLPPAEAGGEPERIELRAMLPQEWEALVALHPPTPEQEQQGAGWDVVTFRPALLAASVVPPDGEEPLSAQDWHELTVQGALTIGEINALFNVAFALNDRSLQVRVGKD